MNPHVSGVSEYFFKDFLTRDFTVSVLPFFKLFRLQRTKGRVKICYTYEMVQLKWEF